MLLSFTVTNFRSFKEAQSLIMVPQDKLTDYESNIALNDKYKALKSIAILGHNASGKSNIVDALSLMQNMIFSFNIKHSYKSLPYFPFAYNDNTVKEPTVFEVEFLFKAKKYRYGFSYNNEKIISEWLFATDNKPRARQRLYFIREASEYTINNMKGAGSLKSRTKENMLFLSVCSFFNIKDVEMVSQWFNEYLETNSSVDALFSDFGINNAVAETISKENSKDKESIIEFMRNADLSIQNIYSEQKTEESKDSDKRILFNTYSIHNIYSNEGIIIGEKKMDFYNTESDGTKKCFNISEGILSTLHKGGVYICDELDNRLHPLLFLHIISLFNSRKTNPKNAQIIFTTHNVTILDIGNMRRDQILFVEKDNLEASKIYPLSQFKVRKGSSFAKSYLFGRYGAIPILTERTGKVSND